MSKYDNEIEMYPDVVKWLQADLEQKYGRTSKKIIVEDTHDSYLSNFIMSLGYEKFFPEFSTYQIQQDITGFIEYEDKVDLVFVECKIGSLSLIHLSQLIGYSCIALPIQAYLLSPKGMGTTLNKLLMTYNRKDILEFRAGKRISVVKWDASKQDIDFNMSVV
ncbi:MAG: hypothetical protein GH151_00555 [Bacteroidetes bacterium]|nr:hypothetical protein [Bacteroidota bacterium]